MDFWQKISVLLIIVSVISIGTIFYINWLRQQSAAKYSNSEIARQALERQHGALEGQLGEANLALWQLQERFKGIIDLEAATLAESSKLQSIQEMATEVQKEVSRLESLRQELQHSILDANQELGAIDCGFYKPIYDYSISQKYKDEIERVRDLQKKMLKSETAAICSQQWTVNGKASEGKKMTRQNIKLMLRAFNGESDAMVAEVTWNNVSRMVERLESVYQSINKLGEDRGIKITRDYFELKLQELKLAYEHQEKLNAEREEQRKIREQIREEERARLEIEKAQKKAEEEERQYQQALEKARRELTLASGAEAEKMQGKIEELEKQLQEALANKERAISRAQQTRSGHVYIISNIGSFGEDRFKIGMTRRLEPLDRVKELSDASVPFDFDVHAMIFSDDAPALEAKLHNRFTDKRLNLINERKEFFYVTIEEIVEVVKEYDANLEIIKTPEAKDYRQTVSIWNSQSQVQSI